MTKTTTTTTTATTFDTLVHDYEMSAETKVYADRKLTKEEQEYYDKSLVTLATAIAYSVLKKCINVSNDASLKAVRASLTRDTKALAMIDYTAETAHKHGYNAEGDYITETVDTDLHNRFNELTRDTLGDGMDIMHTALLSIMSETQKAHNRNDYVSIGFMTKPYTVKRLKRKVWIKIEDSVNGWEEVETTPLREVYKEVRRYIESQKSLRVNTNGYTYLEDVAHDTDTDTDTVIYRRFGKYADMGGEVKDFNGQVTAYTVDTESADKVDTIIEKLNLTAKQMKILQLRQSGYGYKAIATYLGVSFQAVDNTLKRIKAKAIKAGYNVPTTDTAHKDK